jgi:hypothetical protein
MIKIGEKEKFKKFEQKLEVVEINLSSMRSETTDPIVMKFCIVVVCTLRKVYNQVTK